MKTTPVQTLRRSSHYPGPGIPLEAPESFWAKHANGDGGANSTTFYPHAREEFSRGKETGVNLRRLFGIKTRMSRETGGSVREILDHWGVRWSDAGKYRVHASRRGLNLPENSLSRIFTYAVWVNWRSVPSSQSEVDGLCASFRQVNVQDQAKCDPSLLGVGMPRGHRSRREDWWESKRHRKDVGEAFKSLRRESFAPPPGGVNPESSLPLA